MSIDNLSQLKALKLFGMVTALADRQAEASRHTLRQTVVYTDSSTLNWLIDKRAVYAILRAVKFSVIPSTKLLYTALSGI